MFFPKRVSVKSTEYLSECTYQYFLLDEIEGNSNESMRNLKIYDNIEDFDQNLPSTVTLLQNEFDSKVYIVGTAHFSLESQNDVSLVIR